MTELSRPWTGITVGDSGPYSSDDWATIYRNAMGNGAADGDSGPIMGSGIAPDPGLTVNATGPATASVDVTAGAALVHGTFYINSATVNLGIASNVSGNPRIDTIILRKDWTSQTVRLTVLQGSPNATPVAPNLTQSDGVLWEVPLADIAVASGFATLAQSTITPRRAWANVADGIYLPDILNNTAGILVAGDLVDRDTTANRAAKATTAVSDPLVMGVWVSRTPAGGYGRVLQRGVCYVNADAAVTRGQALYPSATAKKVTPIAVGTATTSNLKVVGVALETTSGSGLVLAMIDVTQLRRPAYQVVRYDNGSNMATTSAAFVAITGLTVTITITGSVIQIGFTAAINLISTTPASFDLAVDGVRVGVGGVDGMTMMITNNVLPICLNTIVTGLTPGAHTITVVWRNNGGNNTVIQSGSGAAGTDTIPMLYALEID